MAYHRRQILLFAICYLLIANLWGCAAIKETAKGIVGVSTKVLEDNRKDALGKTFNYDYNSAYKRIKEALIERGCYIYAQDKNMIAVYISETDTTPVGVFFKTIDASHTQIEVSSASIYGKELIWGFVSYVLEPVAEKIEKKEKKE